MAIVDTELKAKDPQVSHGVGPVGVLLQYLLHGQGARALQCLLWVMGWVGVLQCFFCGEEPGVLLQCSFQGFSPSQVPSKSTT